MFARLLSKKNCRFVLCLALAAPVGLALAATVGLALAATVAECRRAAPAQQLTADQMRAAWAGAEGACYYQETSTCQLTVVPGVCDPLVSETQAECEAQSTGCQSCSNDSSVSACIRGGTLYQSCNTQQTTGGCGQPRKTGCQWSVEAPNPGHCKCDDGNWSPDEGPDCDRIEVIGGVAC